MKNNCKHRVIVFILGIFAVSLCLGACFHKCNAKLTIDWGNHSRVMINEEWEHYRITKEMIPKQFLRLSSLMNVLLQ